MFTLLLEIPKDKIKPIFRELGRLGIKAQSIKKINNLPTTNLPSTLHKISVSFILFDWEFFCNELEYE